LHGALKITAKESTMSLQNLIQNKLNNIEFSDIAKQLGYSSPNKILSRINAIVNSPVLTLDQSGYDFHYSTPELINKLCDILNIPPLLCNRVINDIETALKAKQDKFVSYIFMETNFKRKSQPIFMLAALQSKRYLPINNTTQALPLNKQLDRITATIKAHHAQRTALPMWGNINQYVYFYDEQTIVVFSVSGEVIDTVTEYFTPQATLSLK